MSFSIRTFRNTDAHSVCSVWNQHYAELERHHQIDAQHLELFCLAKPYFDNSTFWIAEASSGEVVGFLHAGCQPSCEQDDLDSQSAVISALCVCPRGDDGKIAAALLREFSDYANHLGASQAYYKPMLPSCPFYLCLGPADSLAGATTADVRTCQWLTKNGFAPVTPTSLWELELAFYKPPIDRTQIQIRRAAQVGRQLEEPVMTWWIACVLGHTEPTAFQLTNRQERRVLSEVLYWTLAPDLQASPESIAWLWQPEVTEDAGWPDQMLFLLAESLREFQSERVDVVRTVTPANENAIANILRRLGFSPVDNGMVFGKQLSAEEDPA